MPYKPFKRGSKWEVFKVDDNGKPVGDGLGTHDSKEEAEEQITALNIAEAEGKEAKGMYGGPMDEKMPGEMSKKMPGYGSGATSLKDMMAAEAAHEAAEEVHELTYMFQEVVSNIMASDMDDKDARLVQAAGEFAEMSRQAVQKTKRSNPMEKAIGAVKSLFETKQNDMPFAPDDAPGDMPNPQRRQWAEAANQAMKACMDEGGSDCRAKARKMATEKMGKSKELFIWKEGGRYHWVAAYSNNRRDNDDPPEIISSESHKAFDEAVNKGDYPMPELWLWHLPYRVGVAQWHAYDEANGFPVAAGTFDKGKEWVAEAIMESKEWNGVSHGMPKTAIRRDEADSTIITRHVTKEISILPAWAAANKLSFHFITKEAEMSEAKELPAHKLEGLVALAGEERAKEVQAALADKSKEADEAGLEKKESGADLTKELLKAIDYLNDQVIALGERIEQMEQKEAAEPEGDFDLVSFLKSKSAIGSEKAKVDGRTKEGQDAPQETEPESPSREAAGLPVGLIDRLVAANQSYQNGGRS